MRLRQLNLELFGGFTGQTFDFGPGRGDGASDFHIIVGPNEAGKTTTMEGYLRLLYGFPHREPYDFLHQRKNLRVSGLLNIDGTETEFTRLPTRDPSLRDAHGTELPDSAMQAHLIGLSEEDYRNLLCLDDLTIEKGGEEIARAKGDIGRLLFSAAAGISELSDVLDRVREEADDLFRKRSSKTRFARLKREYSEVDRQIRELDVSATQYRKLKQASDTAHEEEDRVSESRKASFEARAQLEARGNALPLLAEIDELDAKLTPFRDWPAHLDIDPEALVKMLIDQAKAQNSERALVEEIDAMRETLAGIERHPEHLTLERELEDLDSLRSRYATAEVDLDKRRGALSRIVEDMRQVITRDLGASGDVDLGQLVLSPATLSALGQAREGMRDAERQVERERAEVTELEDRIAAADAALSKLETDAPSVVELEEVFERFDVDALSQRHAAATGAVKTARRQALAALDALAIKGDRFDAVPRCPLTLEEAEALLSQAQEIAIQHDAAVHARDESQAVIAERTARIARIRAMDGLIDDAEAHRLRTGRDELWSAHKARLSDETAARFEDAMSRLDSAMDLRLSEAANLGTLRQYEQDLAALEARAEVGETKIEALAGNRQEALDSLSNAARQAGIVAPVTPEAFVVWLRKLETAIQAEAGLRRLQDEHCDVFEQAERLRDLLSKHVHRDASDFDGLVAKGKSILAAQRAHEEKRRAAQARLEDLRGDRDTRTARLDDLADKAADARRDWSELVARALPGELDAKLLEGSLQPLHALREQEKECAGLERQISGMEADQSQFCEKMRELGERVGATVSDKPLADHDALVALAAAARADEDRSRELSARIAEREEVLAETRKTLGEIGLAVSEMARLFPDGVETGSLEALRQAVSTASQVIDDRTRRAQRERELLVALDLTDLEDARAALEGATQADLRAQLDEVGADLESVETLYKSAIEARTAADAELRAICGDSEVALLVERKTTLELEMQEAALRHLELSLGHRLAEEAIRRYRDEHRSAMMQATEAAFAELTNGAYSHLQTQLDGASETLLALDASGMAKQAQDMSKGTRFQLYLALRAAAYEQLTDQGTSLPFFCDDIFETFDEDRTRSACRVMERIGRRGQAIYLTHHQHVVDIAREVCGGGVQIHRIEA
ncbi:YhaN family protein [Maritimibacter sp. HL-12]|uniref:ATP-binding protein n=1 Tax=Maritimibacter sp. HL-12 TaxID=1162418 RepID=UPI0020CB1FB1|nr:YhaN family protein [Maritimibacter sp. HL-12]